MMNWTTIVMLLAPIGAVILIRKDSRRVAWARPAAVGCVLITLVIALTKILAPGDSNEAKAAKARSEHQQYQEACGKVLGLHLAKRHSGESVVILAQSTPSENGSGQQLSRPALVEELITALENAQASVKVQSIKIPEDGFFDGRRLGPLLKKLRGEANLVVSTLDIPSGIDINSLPLPEQGPALALVNAWLPDAQTALEETSLETIVLTRRDSEAWKIGERIPRDPEKAMNKRYQMITEADGTAQRESY